MSSKHETLQEFVSRILAEKKMSFRKAAERTGGQISHSTIADIARGQRFDVKKDTLMALAKALDVPVNDVFRAARGLSSMTQSRYELYAERFDAHDLSDSEWQFIETNINDFVTKFRLFKQQARERAFNPEPDDDK